MNSQYQLQSSQMSQFHSQKKAKNLCQNQTLQQLLQIQTINQGLSSTKKNLFFSQLSFFSKDHTNDHTTQQGYSQILKKMHFQRQRNRQLSQELQTLKKNHIDKYMSELMETFNTLSEQNKILRQQYKKQTGHKRKKDQTNSQKNNSFALTTNINPLNTEHKFNKQNNFNHTQTPRAIKTRKSVTGATFIYGQTHIMNTSLNAKPAFLNSTAFIQHRNRDMTRFMNKQSNCESSTNFHTTEEDLRHLIKKHKRRESQLTQRKDYPHEQDYLQIFDAKSQVSFDDDSSRISNAGNGKMIKKYGQQENEFQPAQNHWANQSKKSQKGYCQNGIIPTKDQPEYFYQATNTKNIFIQFLQQLLIEQKVSSNQLTLQIQTQVDQMSDDHDYSYTNLKHIESLQQQIQKKNKKLQQLQSVVNIYKEQIEQVIGTDIKQINQLMVNLRSVKGKYIEMQQKVNCLGQLKRKYHSKEEMKNNIINKIIDKNKNNENKQYMKHQQEDVFTIPQSIKTLLQMLDVKFKGKPKPGDYLNEIKQLSQNKQLFQAFHSNKRNQAHGKIRQVIESIRQGRKKFNEVIKIYESRIVKLQQKIQKYKNRMVISSHRNSQSKNSIKQFQRMNN